MYGQLLHKYLKGSIKIIVALSLLTLIYIQVWGNVATMAAPLVVCAGFQLVTCILCGYAWKAVAQSKTVSLVSFYLMASMSRLLLAAFTVLVYCLLQDDSSTIIFFAVVFLIFYLAILCFDTYFFVCLENQRNQKN